MANPVEKLIREQTVVTVAENVTDGFINKTPNAEYPGARAMSYIGYYKIAGQAAPTYDDILNDGILMFQDHPEEERISVDVGSDVYVIGIYPNNTDSDVGRLIVRV